MSAPFRFEGAILGIDHGLHVIGLAISRTGYFAEPLQIVKRKSKKEDFAQLRRLIDTHDIQQIVLGLPPKPPDFVGHAQADTVRNWAGYLAKAIELPIYFSDEGLSTYDADQLLDDVGKSPPRKDAHAAAVILQECLDRIRETGESPEQFIPSVDEDS